MGGANCEGEMGVETLRAFPFVDCVVSGEADAIFADMCRCSLPTDAALIRSCFLMAQFRKDT